MAGYQVVVTHNRLLEQLAPVIFKAKYHDLRPSDVISQSVVAECKGCNVLVMGSYFTATALRQLASSAAEITVWCYSDSDMKKYTSSETLRDLLGVNVTVEREHLADYIPKDSEWMRRLFQGSVGRATTAATAGESKDSDKASQDNDFFYQGLRQFALRRGLTLHQAMQLLASADEQMLIDDGQLICEYIDSSTAELLDVSAEYITVKHGDKDVKMGVVVVGTKEVVATAKMLAKRCDIAVVIRYVLQRKEPQTLVSFYTANAKEHSLAFVDDSNGLWKGGGTDDFKGKAFKGELIAMDRLMKMVASST